MTESEYALGEISASLAAIRLELRELTTAVGVLTRVLAVGDEARWQELTPELAEASAFNEWRRSQDDPVDEVLPAAMGEQP